MSIFQISISAAVLILIIAALRFAAIHRLPKNTFWFLWLVALFRLLTPVSIPMPVGVLSLIDSVRDLIIGQGLNTQTVSPANNAIQYINVNAISSGMTVEAVGRASFQIPVLTIVWLTGMFSLALIFLITHFKYRREYQASLPLNNPQINLWLKRQKIRRSIQIRQSDRINAPMTYGLLRPVILFPKNTSWQNETTLQYILAHELTHISRFDILTKWLLAAALCVHWFNPLVWLMYILANRDIELSCDEAVISTFGASAKPAYTLTLINLEEKRIAFAPLCISFSKNSVEERIKAIMKLKRNSVSRIAIAFSLILIITVIALGASRNQEPQAAMPSSSPYYEHLTDFDTEYVYEIFYDINDKIFLESLREYMNEMVQRSNIQEHMMDFSCGLSWCTGGYQQVTIEILGDWGWTGRVRNANGEIQRQLDQQMVAYIRCSECTVSTDAASAYVMWNETWWEEAPEEWLELFSERQLRSFMVDFVPFVGGREE